MLNAVSLLMTRINYQSARLQLRTYLLPTSSSHTYVEVTISKDCTNVTDMFMFTSPDLHVSTSLAYALRLNSQEDTTLHDS